MADDLVQAVEEWRGAREAFFALPPLGPDPKSRVPEPVMRRLANAEHRLMSLAQAMKEAAP